MNNILPSPSQPATAPQLFLNYLTQYGVATAVLAVWATRQAHTEMDVTIAACVTGVVLGALQFVASRALQHRSRSTQLAVNTVASATAAVIGCLAASARMLS